jgi:hypothetical protein
LHLQLLIALCF